MAKIFFDQNYDVYSICKHQSINLEKFCLKTFKVDFKKYSNIKNILESLDPNKKMEILIGSGFAELLKDEKLIYGRLNQGNKIKILKKINSERFFTDLKNEQINIPIWSKKKYNSKGWLIKNFKSFGGGLVTKVSSNYSLKKNEYFQKIISGKHFSLQFFAFRKKVRLLSICNQLFRKESQKPFIIESLITCNIESNLLIKVLKICQKITNIYNLNGINNLDFIIEINSNKVFLIELNARPGLSTNLIYKIHKDIYKNTDNSEKLNKNQYFYGTQIIYSKKDLLINNNRFKLFENLKNSSTFSELPLKDIIIKKNEPICLIHLKSKKTVTLKKNLKNLSNKILNNLD